MVTSGLRIGTPAVTSRGMKEGEMNKIAQLCDQAITHKDDESELNKVKQEVEKLTKEYPIYKELT